ncbi:hypothetical protein [Mycobacterium sp. GA-2829]|uniref:hypothetical protein n=1 Tax=Mycobacterium sp. GA-2829 TaxID=1772283 RepID=UPI00073FD45C|nr:hypothetical protein [Mycobacterium sp. GA-2829]KUI33872.1 hypothetical protein AU194_15035 [Mycobacterium sp. GA-2829]
MANGMKVAVAVGAGYFLGRTRKMRLALMLAGAGLTGKFPSGPTELAAQGLKSLGASADVTQLTEQLRGELLGAARAAALAAATQRVNALNDRLQDVTSVVDTDEVLDDVGENVGGVGETLGGVTGLSRRRGRRAEPEPVEDVDEYDETDELDLDEDTDEDDLDLDEEPEPEPPRRRRASRQPTAAKAAMRRSARATASDEPATSAARHGRSATKRAPVRRGR